MKPRLQCSVPGSVYTCGKKRLPPARHHRKALFFPDDAVVDVKVVGIDVDIARLYAVRDGDFVVREGKDFRRYPNETIFWLDAGRNRQFRVPFKHRKLAVDGNEIFRARERSIIITWFRSHARKACVGGARGLLTITAAGAIGVC